MTLRAKEREAHRATDDHNSAISRKRSITAILSATLAPPTIATSGCAGSLENARERAHLAFEQPPRGAGQQVRDALGARVCTVRSAERIVDVELSELGERTGERRVVALLAGLEAYVLEQQDLAIGERFGECPDLLPHDCRRERDLSAAQRAQPRRDRRQSRALGRRGHRDGQGVRPAPGVLRASAAPRSSAAPPRCACRQRPAPRRRSPARAAR